MPIFPSGVNEHLIIKLHFPLNKYQHITSASAYAPTLTCFHEEKETFYADLDQMIRSTQLSDEFIILGDFNARVGKDTDN